MPNRSRSGVVSSPARVVAPISVNGGRSSVITRAPAPCPTVIGSAPVLHRRIERLLQRPRQPVDLVDEEHRAGLERGQQRGDVGLALERRSRGLHELDVELGGDDLGKRGLPEARRAGEQDVVERLLAGAGRGDRDRELVLDRRLPDEVLEPARAKRAVELLVALHLRIVDPRLVGLVIGESGDGAHRRAVLSAPAIRSSGRSPSVLLEQLVGLGGGVAEPDQPLAGERARVVGSGDRDLRAGSAPSTFSRSSTTIRSAVRLPIPGTACSRAVSPARDGGEQVARRSAREHGERHLRVQPTARRAASRTASAPPRSQSRRAPARRRGRPCGCAAAPDGRRRGPCAASAPRPRPGSRRRRIRSRRGRRGGPRRCRRAARSRRRPLGASRGAGQRAASGARFRSQIATASASAA